MKSKYLLKDSSGAVLVIALLILLLITFLGKATITSSVTERRIAANQRFYKMAFYTAEAGLESTKEILQTEFTIRNQSGIASGQSPDWDFALNGIFPEASPATDSDYSGGAVWVLEQPLESETGFVCLYTVTVWNNPDDPGGSTNDTDQLIHVRSVATGPGGTRSGIEIILRGQTDVEAVTGYFAQAGTGQSNRSRDIRAISDFTVQ